MRVVVPFGAVDPKTRLSPVLDGGERREFAVAMLRDVVEAVRETGREPEVLSRGAVGASVDAPVVRDDRPLTDCVNAVLASTDGPVAVVMADLALATPAALSRLFDAAGDVVLAPGRGGGTNALVARHPEFRVDYHGASYLDHRRAAAGVGADVSVVDSFRLATDVDEPEDVVEVLVHGEGRAADWAGERFALDADEGRVGLRRRDDGSADDGDEADDDESADDGESGAEG